VKTALSACLGYRSRDTKREPSIRSRVINIQTPFTATRSTSGFSRGSYRPHTETGVPGSRCFIWLLISDSSFGCLNYSTANETRKSYFARQLARRRAQGAGPRPGRRRPSSSTAQALQQHGAGPPAARRRPASSTAHGAGPPAARRRPASWAPTPIQNAHACARAPATRATGTRRATRAPGAYTHRQPRPFLSFPASPTWPDRHASPTWPGLASPT